MEETTESCPYPNDLHRCRASLVDAWREGRLEEHCILEGLTADREQCREVLGRGLYDGSSRVAPRQMGGQTTDLDEACKQVVLTGYPQGIVAIPEIFHEAFCGLMYHIIVHRLGFTPDGQPSSDDVFQQAWLNLHEHFLRGARIDRSLAGYVSAVTSHACAKAIRERYRHGESPGTEASTEVADAFAAIPRSVAECWEDVDRGLQRAGQGSVISRIILGHLCLDGWNVETKVSARYLTGQWQQLVQMTDGAVRHLHERAVQQRRNHSNENPVYLVAGMINAGLLRSHQLAIAFMAGMGLDLGQCCQVISEMTNLTANTLHVRINRIRRALDRVGRQ